MFRGETKIVIASGTGLTWLMEMAMVLRDSGNNLSVINLLLVFL